MSQEEPVVLELGLTASQCRMLNHVLSCWLHANKHDMPQVYDNVLAVQQAVEGM